MKIALFNTGSNPIPPKNYGGSQSVTYITAVGLAEKGHEVYLFAPPESKFDEGNLISINEGWGQSNEQSNMKILENYLDKVDVMLDTTAFGLPGKKWKDFPYINRMGGDCNKRYCQYCDRNYIWPSYAHLKFHSQNDCSCSKRRNEMNVEGKVIYKPFSFWNISRNFDDLPYKENKEDYVLYLGLIQEHKGTHLAVEFAKKANIRLKIYGPIQDQVYFNTKIQPHLGNKITYHGSTSGLEKMEILSKAMFTVFPINCSEGAPNVPLESLSVGTPVLTFDKGVMPEIINSSNGLLCKNIDNMVNNYKEIFNVKSNNCRESIVKKF